MGITYVIGLNDAELAMWNLLNEQPYSKELSKFAKSVSDKIEALRVKEREAVSE